MNLSLVLVSVYRVEKEVALACQYQLRLPLVHVEAEPLPVPHHFLLVVLKAESHVRGAQLQGGISRIQQFLELGDRDEGRWKREIDAKQRTKMAKVYHI